MKAVRVAFLGIGVKDGHIMDVPSARLREEGHPVETRCYDSMALDDDIASLPDFLREIVTYDLVIVHVHGDVGFFRHFSEFEETVRKAEVSVFLTCTEFDTALRYRGLFLQDDSQYDLLRKFQEAGGDDNQYATLVWALDALGGMDLKVPDPVLPQTEGVYRHGKTFTLEDGLRDVGKSGRPVVAITFHQKYWLVHNTEAVDYIAEKVEERGAEAVPIFLSSSENSVTGAIGFPNVVDRYLLRNGKPVMDCVVNTMGFSQTLVSNPGKGEQMAADNFFVRLGVPVLQAVSLYDSVSKWKDSPLGLGPADIAMSVVNPEFDGQIDTVPYCGAEPDESGNYRQTPVEDRCEMIADTAYRWAMLRHIPQGKKRIAILLYMYPPRQDLAGGGYGLDTLQSVADMLRVMKDSGYNVEWVPKDGKELVDRLLEGVTNDDNWKSDIQLRDHSVDLVSLEQYDRWFSEIPDSAQKSWKEGWGEPPGDIHTLDGKFLLPGFEDGNIFVGFQPDRGKCTTEAYHDPWKAPPHQYLAFYRWLRDVWKADGVVHVGTHGTLEWLPGKGAGLSKECHPDIVLGNIPNVNPYIIDNPGEGMQAKRRSYAVITTHNIPAMTRSGGYEEINELESAVQAYIKAKQYGQEDNLPSILEKLISIAKGMHILGDIGLKEDCTAAEMAERADALYDYVLGIKDAMIKDGLHILGEVPTGERQIEMLYSLVRYRNGKVPSMRESIAASHGLDMETLLKSPSDMLPDGRTYGEATDSIDGETFSLLRDFQEADFDPEICREKVKERFTDDPKDMLAVTDFVTGFLVPALSKTTDELENIVNALDGKFIEPGPSGCPGRGRAQILPTGRNFYSIDPDGVPWHSSWEIGSKMAEQMVERYVSDKGSYPKSVGIILWATDTMKTGGDDVSYILKLMGLRPVWDGYGGRVKGLEVIPISELKRPRIDVTLRISGLFRDTFPNLCNLIDDGVRTVAALDEDDESNYLAANLRKDVVEAIAGGVPADEARRAASIRVFGDAPGSYGCGISDAVETGEWKTVEDLSDIYVKHGAFVYGRGLQGEAHPELFRKRLAQMDVTVKNHNTRAADMLDMDDDLDCLGGLNAAVRGIRGTAPESYMGDSSDMDNLKLRTAQEECRYVFRSKIDNPKWLEGLKKHGFAGAKELSKLFDYTMGWSATSDIVENWMYDDLANRFVLDDDTREWIKDENPYAMMAMLARLQEAVERGFWKTDDEMLEKLKDVYLDFEERIEEITDR